MGDASAGTGGAGGGGGPGPRSDAVGDNLSTALIAAGKNTSDPAARDMSFAAIRQRMMSTMTVSQSMSTEKQAGIVDSIFAVYETGVTQKSMNAVAKAHNGRTQALAGNGYTVYSTPAHVRGVADEGWLKECPSIEITGVDPRCSVDQCIGITMSSGKITYRVLTDPAVVADAFLYNVSSCTKGRKRKVTSVTKNLETVLREQSDTKKDIFALHTFLLLKHDDLFLVVGPSKTQIGKTDFLFSSVSADHVAATQNSLKKEIFRQQFDLDDMIRDYFKSDVDVTKAEMTATKRLLFDMQDLYSEKPDNSQVDFPPGMVYVLVVIDTIGKYKLLSQFETGILTPKCRFLLGNATESTPVVSIEDMIIDDTRRNYLFNVDVATVRLKKANLMPLNGSTGFLNWLRSSILIYNLREDDWDVVRKLEKIQGHYGNLSGCKKIHNPFISKCLQRTVMIKPELDIEQQAQQQAAQGKPLHSVLALFGCAAEARKVECAPFQLMTVTTSMFVLSFVPILNMEEKVRKALNMSARLILPHESTRKLHWGFFANAFQAKLKNASFNVNFFEFLYDILFYAIISSKPIVVFELVNTFLCNIDGCRRTTFTPVNDDIEMQRFSLQYFLMYIITTLLRTVDVLYGKNKALPISWLRCRNATNRSTISSELCAKIHKSNTSVDQRVANAVCPDYQADMNPSVILKYLAAISLLMKKNGLVDQTAFTAEMDALTTNEAVREAQELIESIVQFRNTSITQNNENGQPLFVADAKPGADNWTIPEADLPFAPTLPSGFPFPAAFKLTAATAPAAAAAAAAPPS